MCVLRGKGERQDTGGASREGQVQVGVAWTGRGTLGQGRCVVNLVRSGEREGTGDLVFTWAVGSWDRNPRESFQLGLG